MTEHLMPRSPQRKEAEAAGEEETRLPNTPTTSNCRRLVAGCVLASFQKDPVPRRCSRSRTREANTATVGTAFCVCLPRLDHRSTNNYAIPDSCWTRARARVSVPPTTCIYRRITAPLPRQLSNNGRGSPAPRMKRARKSRPGAVGPGWRSRRRASEGRPSFGTDATEGRRQHPGPIILAPHG